MIIYVDVLIFLNMTMDFILLSVTEKLVQQKSRLWRKALAAFASSLFSLYIFLPPQPTVIEIMMRLISSSVAVAICFGFGRLRVFLRRFFTFFAVSFVYAGAMAGVFMLFEPRSMSVNNGVVYFDVSPLWLITASVVFYVIIVIAKKLTGKQAERAQNCDITLVLGNEEVKSKAMIDTGHTLNDAFSDSMVMIADKSIAFKLFGEADTYGMLELTLPQSSEVSKRFRLIPVNTVSGEKMLPAVRIDRADILENGKTFRIFKPIVVISNTALGDECSVIVPPEALRL